MMNVSMRAAPAAAVVRRSHAGRAGPASSSSRASSAPAAPRVRRATLARARCAPLGAPQATTHGVRVAHSRGLGLDAALAFRAVRLSAGPARLGRAWVAPRSAAAAAAAAAPAPEVDVSDPEPSPLRTIIAVAVAIGVFAAFAYADLE